MFKLYLFSLGALLLVSTVTQAATVDVRLVKPETFTDFKGGDNDWLDFQDTALAHFQKHLTKLAKQLPEEATLTIDIKNIDLAGRLQWIHTDKIRIIKKHYSPALAFEYQLLDSKNKPLTKGSASLRNIGFFNSGHSRDKHKALGYEKRILTKWFDATLTPFERQI